MGMTEGMEKDTTIGWLRRKKDTEVIELVSDEKYLLLRKEEISRSSTERAGLVRIRDWEMCGAKHQSQA